MRFEVYRNREDGIGGQRQWRWRLIAANNKIVASGEGYMRKGKCLHCVELLKSAANAPVEIVVA